MKFEFQSYPHFQAHLKGMYERKSLGKQKRKWLSTTRGCEPSLHNKNEVLESLCLRGGRNRDLDYLLGPPSTSVWSWGKGLGWDSLGLGAAIY